MARLKAKPRKYKVKGHSKVNKFFQNLLPYLTFLVSISILYKVYQLHTYVEPVINKVYNAIN